MTFLLNSTVIHTYTNNNIISLGANNVTDSIVYNFIDYAVRSLFCNLQVQNSRYKKIRYHSLSTKMFYIACLLFTRCISHYYYILLLYYYCLHYYYIIIIITLIAVDMGGW